MKNLTPKSVGFDSTFLWVRYDKWKVFSLLFILLQKVLLSLE